MVALCCQDSAVDNVHAIVRTFKVLEEAAPIVEKGASDAGLQIEATGALSQIIDPLSGQARDRLAGIYDRSKMRGNLLALAIEYVTNDDRRWALGYYLNRCPPPDAQGEAGSLGGFQLVETTTVPCASLCTTVLV